MSGAAKGLPSPLGDPKGPGEKLVRLVQMEYFSPPCSKTFLAKCCKLLANNLLITDKLKVTMDTNFAWIVAFVAMLVSLNIVHHLIWKSIQQKPLGFQTIYDSALQGPALNFF